MALEIKRFGTADIPAALRLCRQVNWNHVAADWERCLALNPAGCLGGFVEGQMRATCTLTTFGAWGWVGTFLVDEALRGQGCGKQIFGAMLQTAREQGVECLGLDASDAGRPIYLQCGFQMSPWEVELWAGPSAGAADGGETRRLCRFDWDRLLAFDRAATGVDRSRQLRALAEAAGGSVRVLEAAGGDVAAFGFARPGRLTGAIGPVVARELAGACAIVDALRADRRQLDGDRPGGGGASRIPGMADPPGIRDAAAQPPHVPSRTARRARRRRRLRGHRVGHGVRRSERRAGMINRSCRQRVRFPASPAYTPVGCNPTGPANPAPPPFDRLNAPTGPAGGRA
jgi:GNAT superfamily N-acetyltransferase